MIDSFILIVLLTILCTELQLDTVQYRTCLNINKTLEEAFDDVTYDLKGMCLKVPYNLFISNESLEF